MLTRPSMLLGLSAVASLVGYLSPAPPPACVTIEGAEAILAPGRIVLIGEMHGTGQSPSFVSDLVCAALERGLSVTLALEIYREEKGRIDAYLASAGDDADRDALLVGPFWNGEFQDGRRSKAMLSLLDNARRLRQAGLPLTVALLDRLEQTAGGVRDAFMAGRLAAAVEASPGSFVVSLTGNLHARTARGTPWDPEYEPMGMVLGGLLPERSIVALDVAHTGGSAWFCTEPEPSSCRAHGVAPTTADGTGRRIVIRPVVADDGYDGVYAVGALSASPPALGDGSPEARAPLGAGRH